MKVKIYELDVDVHDSGFTPFYRVFEGEMDSIRKAENLARDRQVHNKSMEYLVVVDDYESSSAPEYFTDWVIERCEKDTRKLNLITAK